MLRSGSRVVFSLLLLWSLKTAVRGQELKPGEIHASVSVQEDPAYSYALYLPSNYTPQKSWPILLAFDPSGHGLFPVKLFQKGAEKYGFIVVGSNNSRNFIDPSNAIRLTWHDVIHRFAIDPKRFYTTGLSGGARVASSIAIACKTCVAGVIACAAGLPSGIKTLPETTEWFLATGTTDFNFPEMLDLHVNLDRHRLVNRLEIFDGPHGWMPAEMAEDALAWMQLRAMIKGNMPMDKDFVAQQFQKRTAAAQAFLNQGDVLSAWRADKTIVSDFNKLHDVAATEQELKRLDGSKDLQRAKKNEKDSLDQQARAQGMLFPFVNFLGHGGNDRATLLQLESAVNEQTAKLQAKPDPLTGRAIERALWSALIASVESGQQAMRAKNYTVAKVMFEAATIIHPDLPWPHSSLAEVYAASGDNKHAVSELRKAVDDGLSNPDTLNDKDFDRVRDDPAFKELVAQVAAKAQSKEN
jgi:poly(3-hydroxybutyrate) depolymerase